MNLEKVFVKLILTWRANDGIPEFEGGHWENADQSVSRGPFLEFLEYFNGFPVILLIFAPSGKAKVLSPSRGYAGVSLRWFPSLVKVEPRSSSVGAEQIILHGSPMASIALKVGLSHSLLVCERPARDRGKLGQSTTKSGALDDIDHVVFLSVQKGEIEHFIWFHLLAAYLPMDQVPV